jgi:hypothetical protein
MTFTADHVATVTIEDLDPEQRTNTVKANARVTFDDGNGNVSAVIVPVGYLADNETKRQRAALLKRAAKVASDAQPTA